MSQYFQDNQQCEDLLAPLNYAKPGFSPSKKNFDLEDDLIEPFQDPFDYIKGNQFEPCLSIWSPVITNDIQSTPLYEFPITKKPKIQHEEIQNRTILGCGPISTQSDTSHHTSSDQNKQSVSGQNSFTSKNEESSLINTSHFDQSQCSESQNQNSEGLTKRKRGRKQTEKTQLKKKEYEKISNKQKSAKTNAAYQEKSYILKDTSFNDESNSMDQSEMTKRLTNKKKEYLVEKILDKNGVFDYLNNPTEYKRARKRLQNRESAVRSRLRKKYYQDELEEKIQQLEELQKEMAENNAGLSAENTLLKKQLAYFEDVFAKSSLLGYDNVGCNINKNDLEEFQKNLFKKINSRFYHERDDTPLIDESLDVIAGSSQIKERGDFDDISTNSISHENQVEALRLVRSRSNSSSYSHTGYLFLAVVFCMMCCSSLIVNPQSVIRQFANTSFTKSYQMPSYDGSRKLMFSEENSNNQNLATPIKEDVEMIDETQEEQIKESGVVSFVKNMLSGQYTYLTYMLLSSTCFFFWMTPNCHLLGKFFSRSKQQPAIPTSKRNSGRKSNVHPNLPQRQIQTRSSSKTAANKQ